MREHEIHAFLENCVANVHSTVKGSKAHPREVVARYTAAIAPNFTAWMAYSAVFARHERARFALTDNLRVELADDHQGMLIEFKNSCGVAVTERHNRMVATPVSDIFSLFVDTKFAGLSGTAVCAILEATSAVFIRDLEERARKLGSKNFRYTGVHGAADAAHAELLKQGLFAEANEGYSVPMKHLEYSARMTLSLVNAIWN
jgi:hypothetical protein